MSWSSTGRGVDAVRGCEALERGPLVYCVEQSDMPAGVDVADVRLDSGEIHARYRPDLLGGVHVAEAPGLAREEGVLTGLLHGPAGNGAERRRQIRLTAIPYYAWGNRGFGPTRVWIPR